MSNEYQSSSSTTLEEDDTEYQGSDRVLSGISEGFRQKLFLEKLIQIHHFPVTRRLATMDSLLQIQML